ncbi:hypothetical protein [Acinetobacter sp. WZC-1]|uniref:hypothetical protein n=1 Tax=Acinetobacter sp. WZC-1 TaxID=3459034 RepID=UPI00403E1085
MKIIFIHGMNQQNHNAETLKNHWLNIFQSGINALQLDVCSNDLNIEVPFYGDLILKHQFNNSFDLEAFLPKPLLRRHPAPAVQEPIAAQAATIPVLPHFLKEKNLTFTRRLYLSSQLAKDRALREFAIVLNHFPRLHESLIHKFLIETYMYLANPDFMEEVHQRILLSVGADEELMIIGHSLGSVIAYNLLHCRQPLFQVRRFITLGSPLAFRVIQSRLTQPVTRPETLQGDWYNFYSHDDFLTTFPLAGTPFDFQPAIINQPISTFISKPHEIIGYLQHPSVVKKVLELIA